MKSEDHDTKQPGRNVRDDDSKIILRGSEQRLRYALRGAGAGMWDWDVVGGHLTWDQAYYELYGLDRSVLPGFENWIASLHPDDRNHTREAVRNLFEKKLSELRVEYRILHKEKGERWLSCMGYAAFAKDGSPLRMTGVCVDITDRKRAESEREELNRHRQLALSAARMGWWHSNLVSGASGWDDRFKEVFGVTESALNSEEIYSRIHPDDVAQVRAAVEAALNPVDPRPYGIEYRVRHPDGKTVWVEAHGLATFAGTNGDRRATSFAGTVADITARRQAEEALRDSVEFNRNLIRSMQDGFSALDASGVHVKVNPSLCAMTGFSRDELIGTAPPYLYWPPEEYENIEKAFRETLAGNFGNFELIFMRKSGERFPVIVSPFAIRNARGETISFAATVKDITQRKRAEDALRVSDERLRLAYRSAAAGAWEWDLKTNQNFWSDELWSVFGLEPNSCAPSSESWWNLVHPDDRPAIELVLQETLRANGELSFEWRLNRPAEERWLLSRAQPVRDVGGTVVRYIGIVLDITLRKRAEQELQRSRDELEQRVIERTVELQASETRFHQVTDAIDQVFWLSTVDKQALLYISPGYERIWGRTCQSVLDSPLTWLEAIHPDDRARVMEAAMTKQHLGLYDEEYRIVRPDGTERWIRDRAFPIRDESGNVTRLAGVADDITEKKKMEREMIAVIEREQQRIGRDLHDGLCQILTGAKFKIALLGQKIIGGGMVSGPSEAGSIELLLDEAIEQARGIAYGLNPVPARPGGLIEALEQLAAQMDSPSGIRCRCEIIDVVQIREPFVATQLYRIAQEAVQNAIKHSRAKTIVIELAQRAGLPTLSISDDGVGLPGPVESLPGTGLFNMQARANTLGGTLEIKSTPAGGTAVICSFFPYPPAQEGPS